MKVKIEVGQVWKAIWPAHPNFVITVISIDQDRNVWRIDQNGKKGVFTGVDADGYAILLETNWELVSPKTSVAVSPTAKECPCGIFRGDCDYHR
jgi:hypothetical protein